VRNQVDLETAPSTALTVRLTPFTATEPLRAMYFRAPAAQRQARPVAPTGVTARTVARAVDMPAHQMPAEAVGEPQRLLQVDRAPAAKPATPQRLLRHVGLEMRRRSSCDHGQADAV
jgi:hypothetical protein